MRKIILHILFVCLFVCTAHAMYYEITSNIYTPALTLQTGDSLYMTDGGFDSLTLRYNSTATVKGTSLLSEGFGGIWFLGMAGTSTLNMSGGQVNQLDLNNSATAILTGGLIKGIFSYQSAWKYAGDPPSLIPNPHITIVYSGALPIRNPTTQMLTGLWGDGSSFSIYLPNITGYSPAMENIKFQLIPEPISLILLGFGGFMLRRKK